MEQDILTTLQKFGEVDVQHTPRLFNLQDTAQHDAFATLVRLGEIVAVRDDYREQLKELFFVQNPTLVFHPEGKNRCDEYVRALETTRPLEEQGIWAYFPWSRTLGHVLAEEDFYAVRTARNAHLIAPEEQARYARAVIAVAGMSIGSSIVYALGMQGVGGEFRLADMDTLALSNTNRILAGVGELGLPKIVMVARRLWETNPYLHIKLYEDGLTEETTSSFLEGAHVVVDEVDSLAAKVRIRQEARTRKIPVVMAADCGESSILDVERYDHDPQPDFFHGRLGDITLEELQHLHKKEIGRLIATQVGVENHSERMLYSLTEMGRSVVSWPQLGSTALLNAAAVAFCVRHILAGASLIDNRAVISLEQLLDPQHGEAAHSRKEIEEKFRAMFDIL